MRIVLDTNVFISGVFFRGPPRRLLEAWRDGMVRVVFSPEIFEEYQSVGDRLSERYEGVDLVPFLELLVVEGELVEAISLEEPVSEDPDDDKFLACAFAADVEVVVSGDGDLLSVSGWRGVEVVIPSEFVRRFLEGGGSR